jgi:hypothetical protein
LNKEKSIYEHLNKLTHHRSISYGYFWSPLNQKHLLEAYYGPEPEEGIIGKIDNARRLQINIEPVPFSKI